jgi:hypothetical protein
MCRQLSRFEDDGGLVVVIAQFCVARRGEGDDTSLSRRQPLGRADLQGIGTSAFGLLPLPALKDWTT